MKPIRPTVIHQREQSEPTERFRPIPLPYLLFVAALTLIGFIYMVRFAGDEGLHGDMRTPAALMATTQKGASGEQLYTSLCVACHQASGHGLPGVFPPLATSEWVTGAPELPAKILLLGLTGTVHVQGTAYTGQMPSFHQHSDEEIAALLTYIRSSWGNGAVAVTPELVKQTRESLKDRTEPWKGEDEIGRPH